jgi:quinoprotein glucose dehydrogenase
MTAVPGVEPPPPPRQPTIAAASDEPAKVAAGFGLPDGFEARLFAAEPDVANPVAFSIDEQGRVFVCEVFRAGRGVADNNGREDGAWLEADLASRTVADRFAYHVRLLGGTARDWVVESDRVRELVDADGDGRADRSTVFATGFNRLVDGLGGGVLARRGDVLFACIPNLWRLRDADGDGVADDRVALHTGYGVRTAFYGHDLHGLTPGPDGRIYFSIGDRGYHVEQQGRTLADPESGAVFRCEPDGTGLEVVATGLRNPQELAFDDLGNLFTVDNNSDSGDRARLVQVVPGGDSGWRMSGQYRGDRGPFGREQLWHLAHDGQPAWIVPPLAHIGAGPSGLAAYPGTGLTQHFAGRFFLADFRGAAVTSCVRTFRVRPQGAAFELCDEEETFRHVLATDVEVGPDGALWVSDWVHGWKGEGKGRLWRFVPAGLSAADAADRGAVVGEVRDLLAGDWRVLDAARLVGLLGHADRRVRLESQWELARREEAARLIAVAAAGGSPLPARVHAIWGLGQIGRRANRPDVLSALMDRLADRDWELRMVAARTLGDLRAAAAAAPLAAVLADSHPHVRATAAIALGRIAGTAPQVATSVLDALVSAVVRESAAGFDPHARHALVMGVAGAADAAARGDLARHADPGVRLVACLAMRRHGDAAIADRLADADPRVAIEAARAIHDVPIAAGSSRLAARLLDAPDFRSTGAAAAGNADAFIRRAIAASEREGTPDAAARLTRLVLREDVSLGRRMEAVAVLRDWAAPPSRDRVLGCWRPFTAPRDAAVARSALTAALPEILGSRIDERLRASVLQAASALGVEGVGPLLAAYCEDTTRDPASRAATLAVLGSRGDPAAGPLASRLAGDREAVVRTASRKVRAARGEGRPALVAELAAVCKTTAADDGALREQQAAIDLLATIDDDSAREAVRRLVARLEAGDLDPRLSLELIEAAGGGAELVGRLAAGGRDVLSGGDAARGRDLFLNNGTVQCSRCHRVEGAGGEVGPKLDGIASRRDRAYLLESILQPSAQMADGYRTTVVITDEGRTVSGIVKEETAAELVIMTADGKLERVPVDSIDDRSAGPSAMPADIATKLSRRELRDLVEWLSSLRD